MEDSALKAGKTLQGVRPSILWSDENSNPLEDLRNYLRDVYIQAAEFQLFPEPTVRVYDGGVHLDGVWVMPSAVKRMTREVRDLQKSVAGVLDAVEIQKLEKAKRDTGAGRVPNHGPRAKSTFGHRGRKNY